MIPAALERPTSILRSPNDWVGSTSNADLCVRTWRHRLVNLFFTARLWIRDTRIVAMAS